MKSPIIGISAALLPIESGSFIGLERSTVGHDYVQAVQEAGGVPFVMPIVKEKKLIEQQMDFVDGLLLSGGEDVCPLQYGEEPDKGLEAICPKRDFYELELIHAAVRLNKPILGICRGLQLLNVAFGGTLYQDIALSFPTALQHHSKVKPDEATHNVAILPNTILHRIINEDTILTNSFHHQAIKNVAPHLLVNARAKDGMIEGIENANGRFILGVQWHPELMFAKHPHMLKLFHAFIEAARKKRAA
jgi:putative glutamine amidotransferase